jgi:hypothetical protein
VIEQLSPLENPKSWALAHDLRGQENLSLGAKRKQGELFSNAIADFRVALAGEIQAERSDKAWLDLAIASEQKARLSNELADVLAGLDAYRDAIRKLSPDNSLDDWVTAKLRFATSASSPRISH